MNNRRAVWECYSCPTGQPHVWSTSVANRSRGSNCPYCANRDLCLHNSLATIADRRILKYWKNSKNEAEPHQVLAGSNFRAEWKCPDCKWEWQAPIANRVTANAGCPKCSLKTRRRPHHPTFEEDTHHVMADWDHERTAADGNFPHNTTHGSGKLVHWTCKCCPKGRLHCYQASANNRTSSNHSGCPYCAGKQVCVCNSLESLYPSIAAELDCDKNGFTASEVTAQSGKCVWWRDNQGRSWRQCVKGRTQLEASCLRMHSSKVICRKQNISSRQGTFSTA